MRQIRVGFQEKMLKVELKTDLMSLPFEVNFEVGLNVPVKKSNYMTVLNPSVSA